MKCEKCGVKIETEEDVQKHLGKTFCEDCYIDEQHVPRPCDPGAVYSARKTREMLGQKGSEGLTPRQKEIYDFLKEKGKATHQEVIQALNIPPQDLQKEFAILRHCELVKGSKEGNTIYLTVME